MRIAVLGAGYAGLTLAGQLEKRLPESVGIVVVNDRPDHLVQHELHRVVRRRSLADHITIDLDAVFDRATVRRAEVTDVDPDDGVATLSEEGEGEEALDYDIAAV